MEVRFADNSAIAPCDQGEIESVLRRVAWPHPVAAVTVTRRLAGGRSGAEVLDVLVRRAESTVESRHVVKLGPADEVAQEWTAYKHCIEGETNVLCTQIVARGKDGLPGDREAVVYQHAAAFAASPNAPVSTLEEQISAALSGVAGATESAVAAIKLLLDRAGNTLYAGAGPSAERSKFTWLNRTLGVDLVVEVDRGVPPSTLRFGAPLLAQLREQRRHSRDVLMAACDPGSSLAPRSLLRIQMDRAELSGDTLVASADDIAIRVVLAEEHAPDLRLADFACDGQVDLHGRIVSTRAGVHRERVAAVADLSEVGDPWGSLESLLTARMDGWIASTVHGDLNPRNVVLVHDQPYLIDYARAERGQPLLGDPAWLEVCVLRDIVSKHLSWQELVQLQRRLGLAMRVGAAADVIIADDLRPSFQAALHVLWAVRCGARALHRGPRSWWRDYLAQLSIAAHRTFKWADQDECQLLGSAAAAAVVTELLGNPFEYVRSSTYLGLRQHVVNLLDPADPETAVLLADLARSWWSRSRRLVGAFTTTLREVVRVRFAVEAARLLDDLRDDHEVFINLQAFINLRGDLRGEAPGDAIALIAKQPEAVVLGEAGSGKSTVVRELQYLLANAVVGNETPSWVVPRMPVLLRASEVAKGVDAANLLQAFDHTALTDLDQWLAVGGLHIFIDAFNELSVDDRRTVAEWVTELRSQYPLTPVVMCHRSFNYDPDLLAFPQITLHDVPVEDARSYVTTWLQQRNRPDHADLLNTMLFDGPEHETLRDLARKPLFLWMIVEWYANTQRIPNTVGELFDQFTRWYLEERHHTDRGEQPVLRYGLTDKVPFLEKIASHLVAFGNITEISRDAVRELVVPLRTDWEEVLDEIIRSDMLQTDGDNIRFQHQLFQEYFAAHVLISEAQNNRAGIRDLILTFAWREPTRILLGSPSTPPELATFILDTAIEANPGYAATLLRDAENPPVETMGRFLAAQRAALRSPSTGSTGWLRSATALKSLGTPGAAAVLREVVMASHLPAPAQVSALEALTGIAGEAQLVEVVLSVLSDADRHDDVKACALKVIGQARLTPLVGHAWELASDRASWQVAHAAYRALKALRVILTHEVESRMTAVFTARLVAIEAELPTASDGHVVGSLLAQRLSVLEELALRGDFRSVLERVFAFGVETWVLDVDGTAEIAKEHDQVVSLILGTEEETPEQLLRLFEQEEDDLLATAAAYLLLLSDEPPLAAMLSSIDHNSSPARLLSAAAVVEALGEDGAAPVEGIVRGLLANYRPELLEPLCALIAAAPAGPTGLCYRLMQSFEDRLKGEGVLDRWPWVSVVYDAHLPSTDQLLALISHGEEGVWAALNRVSSHEGLYDGEDSSVFHMDFQAEQLGALLASRPEPGDQKATLYATALCAFGVASQFDYIREVVTNPGHLSTVSEEGFQSYGTIAGSHGGDLLAALGSLGRRADDTTAQKVWDFLRTFDASPWHPCVRRSQLVGLGVMGDWTGLLSELAQGDRLMHGAAVNVVENWVPGPYSPDGGLHSVGEWVVEELERPLDPEVRSTLEKVKDVVEEKLRRYVVLGDAKEEGRPPNGERPPVNSAD